MIFCHEWLQLQDDPWIQDSEPIYAMDGAHSMLFKTFSGKLIMACHCPSDHMKKKTSFI